MCNISVSRCNPALSYKFPGYHSPSDSLSFHVLTHLAWICISSSELFKHMVAAGFSSALDCITCCDIYLTPSDFKDHLSSGQCAFGVILDYLICRNFTLKNGCEEWHQALNTWSVMVQRHLDKMLQKEGSSLHAWSLYHILQPKLIWGLKGLIKHNKTLADPFSVTYVQHPRYKPWLCCTPAKILKSNKWTSEILWITTVLASVRWRLRAWGSIQIFW